MDEKEKAAVLDEVRRWAVFVHKRYITEDRKPEMCYITRVSRSGHNGKIETIHYRVGSPKGFLTKTSADYFVTHSFKEWV